MSKGSFDSSLRAYIAYNSYLSRKISEKSLAYEISSYKELEKVRSELRVANRTSKEILKNQLAVQEKKVNQQQLKSRIFKLNEFIGYLENLEDKIVLVHILNGSFKVLLSDIRFCGEELEEIADKAYAKSVYDRLMMLERSLVEHQKNYQREPISRLDSLIEELNFEEESLDRGIKENKEKILGIKVPRPKNGLRQFLIIPLSVSLLSLFVLIVEGNVFGSLLSLFWVLIFGIPFFLLFRRELKWKREVLPELQNQLDEARESIDMRIESLEQKKMDLSYHSAYKTIEDITRRHPSLDTVTQKVTEFDPFQ